MMESGIRNALQILALKNRDKWKKLKKIQSIYRWTCLKRIRFKTIFPIFQAKTGNQQNKQSQGSSEYNQNFNVSFQVSDLEIWLKIRDDAGIIKKYNKNEWRYLRF